MLNNNFDNIILIIILGLIMNFLYFIIIKCIKAIHNLLFHNMDQYKVIYFKNHYGFTNEIFLKYILELFIGFLCDYYYLRAPKSIKISIGFYQINPKTKEYYPISTI